MEKKRIEYIDAMRGITMLLVVYSHVVNFNLDYVNHSQVFSYNSIFTQFRMPLFFFISGFVFYKVDRLWDFNNIYIFIKKKISVQFFSPIVFIVLSYFLLDENILKTMQSDSKSGYWFTFALFEYYVCYIILDSLFQLVHMRNKTKDILFIIIGLLSYIVFRESVLCQTGISKSIIMTLGLTKLNYFIYFLFGTRCKEWFDKFQKLLDNDMFMTIIIISFVVFNIIIFNFKGLVYSFAWLLSGFVGIIIMFSFFRSHQYFLKQDSILGRVLQFVGRRTLDIYLIHYFFVKQDLTHILPKFYEYQVPFGEFVISILLAAIVVACSLLVSAFIRQSQLLGHFLFGAKIK